ncbi:MAG: hypothetical protein Q9165_001516 [Trypethelium subeluteriae]
MEEADHHEDENGYDEGYARPRQLPDDLPRSLDDRKNFPSYRSETEVYDAWQGQSQFLTTPVPAQPLNFNLSLDHDHNDNSPYQQEDFGQKVDDADSRLEQMLASQARLQDSGGIDEVALLNDEKLSSEDKKEMLQSMLTMAASNGDVDRIRRLLKGKAKDLIDINAPDAEGTPSLIYASCFGHQDVVAYLLESGADVDRQDRNQWSALMWAMTNRHKDIAKILLDHGASTDVKSSTGRTAFDFVAPNSEISEYLHESGYSIGNAGVTDDFYNSGFSQDRFEEEMAENEMKRRMMMESAINLEVDLGNLGLDEQPEESDLDRILNIIITNMTPQRSPSQKPVPANILFLSARYAHYHANPDLLEALLVSAMLKINAVVERHQWDMTILAFWISNATLLLHYLKKDAGLVEATTEFQLQIAELVNEIFILITRDAERRMDKVLDAAMLDHETIPGLTDDVTFQNEWKIFKTKNKVKAPEPIEKSYRPPSPRRRAQISPKNITSLLSSTLFVLDLYDIHSVITSQILAQLFYWLGAELFNRIMSNKKYLARTKAMQVRMNVSTLEDWARTNNRQAEHYENGSMTSTGETLVDSARRHLAPVVQLLQWLQCFSSLGEDVDSLIATLQQLPRLTPQQLIHAVKHYRAEVGEKGLPKSAMKYLKDLQAEATDRKAKQRRGVNKTPALGDKKPGSIPSTPVQEKHDPNHASPNPGQHEEDDFDDAPEHLLLNPSLTLPFTLPTSTDMLVSYGAGFGGLNKERERKYIPTVPAEFLVKLDPGGSKQGSVYDRNQWDDEALT